VRLGAALIVRDVAEHLERCLISIRDLVDEIVVVDTGSVDDTVAVARRHGALVDFVPWQGDFATPRNRSLDLLDADWVLYIDADEAVEGPPEGLRSLLADATDHVAFRVRFVPRVGWTAYHEFRLWRHRPEIRFHGLIHESVVGAIAAVADADGLVIGTTDRITIQHYGYEGDQRHKFARDEPMLRAQLENDPDRIFLYDHLARIHEATGDAVGAVEWWDRGVARIRARSWVHPDDRLVYINLVVHRVLHGDRGDDLVALVEEARQRFPGIPSLEFAAGTLAFARGDAATAVRHAEWLVALTPAEVEATGSAYDARVLGEWAWNLLGLGRFAEGDDRGAAEAFRAAEAAAPDDPAYRTRRALAEARARGAGS
jgi:glycosyltransferase involved in cell wall biosynthesis